ncbi:hypothetical protein [Brenneria tiliae]|uniref:Glycosyl transferase family 1 domain-containing protein n=1 Tax=Brenneria tiliae TaxID=2914984 RepID=A0ABT0MNP2_9GAMM|nr:hypothetical protein [Brenneria tiliae]MCL2891421.1 hypothetical protein [Brenneria tiliae]
MKSWGRMGNYEAAKKIQKGVTGDNLFSAELICFDDLFPIFKQFGLRMQDIAAQHDTLQKKTMLYNVLIDEIDVWLNNDVNELTINKKLLKLTKRFSPTIIICTKGVIARMFNTFKEKYSVDIKIVNFITNPGLLDIKIHKFYNSDLTIRTTNYYPNHDEVKKFKKLETVSFFNMTLDYKIVKQDTPTILILCNGCADGYLNVLETTLEHSSHPKVIMVVISNEYLYKECIKLNKKYKNKALICNKLPNKDYLKFALDASSNNRSFLYSKSGPNTILESIKLGLPVLVHLSGLPMEKWIIDLIKKKKFGFCFSNQEDGAFLVKKWLDNPEIVIRFKHKIELNKINESNDLYLKDLPGILYTVVMNSNT